MKKCRVSYDDWSCMLSRKFQFQKLHNETVDGYVSLIQIYKVTQPQVWNFRGDDITVCQDGYQWLTILPANEKYCITAMMNENKEILLWYIDMIASQGVDQDQVPYFYDLYLDLVVYPDGFIYEDDRDELEEALKTGDINKKLFELANKTEKTLKKGVLADINGLKEYTYQCYDFVTNRK